MQEKMQDNQIVDLFIVRDENAIALCSDRYGKSLVTISKRIVEDTETALECTNDAYYEAWNLIPPNEPRTYLFAFLAKIVRSISLDVCKKSSAKKRSANLIELSDELLECVPDIKSSVEEQVVSAELGRILDAFLMGQKKENRQIFLRRYWYMDSVDEISKSFGCTKSKVKMVLFRMRNELKKFLEKEGF